jgi:hypothetical protein
MIPPFELRYDPVLLLIVAAVQEIRHIARVAPRAHDKFFCAYQILGTQLELRFRASSGAQSID